MGLEHFQEHRIIIIIVAIVELLVFVIIPAILITWVIIKEIKKKAKGKRTCPQKSKQTK